jgi:hypothetical protein
VHVTFVKCKRKCQKTQRVDLLPTANRVPNMSETGRSKRFFFFEKVAGALLYHVAFYFLDFLEMDHVAFGGRATCLAATLDLCLGGRQPVNVT